MPGKVISHSTILLCSVFFVISCGSSDNNTSDTKVIYGSDDRRDLFDSYISSTMKSLASSTVALVKTKAISESSSLTYRISGVTFGTKAKLCAGERFREQPAAAHCSGFLVGPDLVVTAGHCIRDEKACEATSFVFGYAMTSRDSNPSIVKRSNVYGCRSIVKTSATPDLDFAVIRLSRKVTDQQPLKFRRSGKPYAGTRLTLIGNPSGLPTKVAKNATIRSNSHQNYLVATTDSFGGNSGSAVFNSQTGVVEGILVRGERDFVSNGTCNKVKRCSISECRGEDVTRAPSFAQYIR